MSEREQSLLTEPCDICGAQAVAIISDCQNREPVEGKGKLSGKLFRRIKRRGGPRAFCSRHLRPPRLYGVNGKLLEEKPIAG